MGWWAEAAVEGARPVTVARHGAEQRSICAIVAEMREARLRPRPDEALTAAQVQHRLWLRLYDAPKCHVVRRTFETRLVHVERPTTLQVAEPERAAHAVGLKPEIEAAAEDTHGIPYPGNAADLSGVACRDLD